MNYRCVTCGDTMSFDPGLMLCRRCGNGGRLPGPGDPIRGCLEAVYTAAELEEMGPPYLPIDSRWFPPIPVGDTPLFRPERLALELGFPGLLLKDDTRNPTGSLKDRASVLVAAQAKVLGIREVVAASTGNAGSSIAGIGAAAGLDVVLFIPASAPPGKLVQSRQYGAAVNEVDGTYDDAYERALDYAEERGALCRNTGLNPMTVEGKKTVAVEIVKQLGGAPDTVFVPVGDGAILAGVYRGFEDMVRLGSIRAVPKIYAVQARGSDAIARAMDTGFPVDPRETDTVADSLSVKVPRNGRMALAKLVEHAGSCVTVSDVEILRAQLLLSSRAGVFAEPSAAASLAGFIAVSETIDRESTVVLLITGTGLKDLDGARAGLELSGGIAR